MATGGEDKGGDAFKDFLSEVLAEIGIVAG